MDSVFILTLTFIFLTALVGIFLQRRARDRCLKNFEGFRVTVEFKDGRRVWGRLAVFPADIELFYQQPRLDTQGHQETSYVIFGAQFGEVQAIRRYHDELLPSSEQARMQDLQRSYHPNLLRRALRGIRNFLNTFRDAFNQSIGVILLQAKKSANSKVLQSQDKQLSAIGTTVLGAAANAYEPILERYIGRKVVVEERCGDRWVEHVGVLKEYTAAWIELLDCREHHEDRFDLGARDRLSENQSLDFAVTQRDDGSAELTITCRAAEPLRLERVELGEQRTELGLELGPEQSHHLTLSELDAEGAGPTPILVVSASRPVDLCLPRAHAVLRHGGEPLETFWERRARERAGSDT